MVTDHNAKPHPPQPGGEPDPCPKVELTFATYVCVAVGGTLAAALVGFLLGVAGGVAVVTYRLFVGG